MAQLQSYIDELRMLCGNRTDIDSVIITSLNAAVATLRNKDVLASGAMFGSVDVSIKDGGGNPYPQPLEVDFPSGMVAVSAVAWAPLPSGTPFTKLSYMVLEETLVADPVTSRHPLAWTTAGTRIRFLPTITEPFRIRVLGARDYDYLSQPTDQVPIMNRQRPACIALARSFISLYLGEVEASAAQAQLARLLASFDLGVLGNAQVLRSEGVKPYAMD